MPETLHADVQAQLEAFNTRRELLFEVPQFNLYLTNGATRTFNGQTYTHRPFDLRGSVSRSANGSTNRASLRFLNSDGWWAGYVNRPDFPGAAASLVVIFPDSLVAGDATSSTKYHVPMRGRISNVRRSLDLSLDIVGQDDARPALYRTAGPMCEYNFGDEDCQAARTEASVTVFDSGANWLRFAEALSTTFDFWRAAEVRCETVADTSRNININDSRLCIGYVGDQVTGSDIAVDATANTYTSGSSGFDEDHYANGDLVYISGFSNAGNNGVKTVVSCTSSVLTVEDTDGDLVDEAAGASVTVDGRVVRLDYTFEVQPDTDDTFTLVESCDQTRPDCEDRKNNVLNFGGFPNSTQEIYPLSPKIKRVT